MKCTCPAITFVPIRISFIHLQGAALVAVRILRANKKFHPTFFHSLDADGHKGRTLQVDI